MLLSNKQMKGWKEIEPVFGELVALCYEYEIMQWVGPIEKFRDEMKANIESSKNQKTHRE